MNTAKSTSAGRRQASTNPPLPRRRAAARGPPGTAATRLAQILAGVVERGLPLVLGLGAADDAVGGVEERGLDVDARDGRGAREPADERLDGRVVVDLVELGVLRGQAARDALDRLDRVRRGEDLRR